MTTTFNLPDDLASAVKQRAAQGGHDVAAEVVELVRKGLAVSEHAGDAARVAPTITTDPDTGLPVIQSPPDAPIHHMNSEELQALIERTQLEEDLERSGLPLRR
jgi:plasmid stability protein